MGVLRFREVYTSSCFSITIALLIGTAGAIGLVIDDLSQAIKLKVAAIE